MTIPDFKTIEKILVELAEPFDLEHLDRTEHGTWMLIFDHQDDVIEISYEEVRQILTLSKELNAPSEANRASLHTLALQYNFIWEETGGGRLSIESPESPLTYSVDINLALCTLSYLKEIISNVQMVSKSWSVIISAEQADNAIQQDLPPESWMKL